MNITNINDSETAKTAWLKRKLEIDELNLPDYERPLLVDTRKLKNPFTTQASRYGFAGACIRYLLP